MQPTISVALATYNGAAYLPELLASLQRQTLVPMEVVVCDDASQDATPEILEAHRSLLPLHIHRNTSPLGVVRNFRKAIGLCQGEYVALCDQDDIWLPGRLARTVEKLGRIDAAYPGLVFTDLTVIDGQERVLAPSYWAMRQIDPVRETFRTLLYGNVITGCTVMMNRRMVAEMNQMPDHVIMHDYWAATIAFSIGRYDYINEPTVLYRQHGHNVTQNPKVTAFSRLQTAFELITGRMAPDFLTDHIQQAELFLTQYQTRLNASQQETLKRFIALRGSSTVYRKWHAFLAKQYR